MALLDLFSNRKEPKTHDVYNYDEIPEKLRGQVQHILEDLEVLGARHGAQVFGLVHQELLREYGRGSLCSRPTTSRKEDMRVFILQESSVEQFLDILELFFNLSWDSILHFFDREALAKVSVLINETNQRFLRAAVGYQFVDRKFIRVDSTYVHHDVVIPSLKLLAHKDFLGPSDEYRKAHAYFQKQDYSSCLVECNKAFESTMKVILQNKGWHFEPTDTAKKLIVALQNNGLFPSYMATSLNHLVGILTSTVPTVRNKQAGHGQGSRIVPVQEEFAAFCLHSTAADILLLAKLAGY